MEKNTQQEKSLAMFQGEGIRRHWDDKKELWYFSVVDVVGSLIDQSDHKKSQSYWTTLKNRLKEEGSEVVTSCDQLKMEADDDFVCQENSDHFADVSKMVKIGLNTLREIEKTNGWIFNRIRN